MKSLIILLLIVLGASSAQAQKVKVNADPRADLSSYKTYGWDKLPPGNPIILQTIIEAVEQAMATKGLVKVESEPDITVVFFVATDSDLQVGYPSWSNAMGSAPSTGIAVGSQSWTVTKGSLFLDIVDRKTKESVWRGTATHTLEHGPTGDVAKDAKSVAGPIRKSIQKMFKQFPRPS